VDVVDDQKDSFSTSCWKDGGIDFVILPEADDDDEGEVEGDDVEDDTGRSHHPYGDGRDGLIAVGTKKRHERGRGQRSRDRVVKDRRPWHSRESEDEDVCVSTTTQKDGCWHVHDVVSSLGFDVSTSKDCDGTILRTVVDVGRLVSEVQFWGRWIDATRYCVCAGRDDLCASFVSLVRPRTSIVGTIVVGVVSRKIDDAFSSSSFAWEGRHRIQRTFAFIDVFLSSCCLDATTNDDLSTVERRWNYWFHRCT